MGYWNEITFVINKYATQVIKPLNYNSPPKLFTHHLSWYDK